MVRHDAEPAGGRKRGRRCFLRNIGIAQPPVDPNAGRVSYGAVYNGHPALLKDVVRFSAGSALLSVEGGAPKPAGFKASL